MQMVNCNKCGKPIDHTHRFRLVETAVIQHMDCDDPYGIKIDFMKKALPDFTWENKAKTV